MKTKYFKNNSEYFKYIKHKYVDVINVTFTKNKKIKLLYNRLKEV